LRITSRKEGIAHTDLLLSLTASVRLQGSSVRPRPSKLMFPSNAVQPAGTLAVTLTESLPSAVTLPTMNVEAGTRTTHAVPDALAVGAPLAGFDVNCDTVVRTKSTCVLRLVASTCAMRKPFCNDSATLRMRVLTMNVWNDGPAATASMPSSTTAISISISVKPAEPCR
jgi:hypothetical protein